MKKNITILHLALLFQGILFSQTVPNAGFESWHTIGGWYDEPVDWISNNTSIMAPAVFVDSIAYQGLVAMRVENVTSIPGTVYCGFPLIQHPQTVKAFVKTQILASDSVEIKAILYFSGAAVDSGKWTAIQSPPPNWNQISFPISQTSVNVDSIVISVQGGGLVGTWVVLDQFSLDMTTKIESNENEPNMRISPNPMTEFATLDLGGDNHSSTTLEIFDLSGKLIRSQLNLPTSQVIIEKGELSPGSYFILLKSETDIIGRVRLVVN